MRIVPSILLSVLLASCASLSAKEDQNTIRSVAQDSQVREGTAYMIGESAIICEGPWEFDLAAARLNERLGRSPLTVLVVESINSSDRIRRSMLKPFLVSAPTVFVEPVLGHRGVCVTVTKK
jgi:hypothetical protein